jgi:hypothetical protein
MFTSLDECPFDAFIEVSRYVSSGLLWEADLASSSSAGGPWHEA